MILDYFKKLETADTDKVEPIGHITGINSVLREDEVLVCDEDVKKGIADNFPQTVNNKVKVKSVL